MPTVSVVIPVYNRDGLIGRAIESVQAQTFSDWELIVVDDGSTDDSVRVAQSYADVDDRIRVIRQDKNAGATVARNRGIEEAKGEWIAFNDSDDEWLPHRLSSQFERLAELETAGEPKPGVVYGHVKIIEVIGSEWEFRRGREGDVEQAMHQEYFACTPTLLILKSLLNEVGGFDKTLRCSDEYELHLRMCRVTRYTMVDDAIVTVHLQSNSRRKKELGFVEIYKRHGKNLKRFNSKAQHVKTGVENLWGLSWRKYPKDALWMLQYCFRVHPIFCFKYFGIQMYRKIKK